MTNLFPYKLIAFDIDGTLLTSQGEMTTRTTEAIQRARASGMIVTLATGRRYVTALPIIESLHIRGAVIVQTGALVLNATTRAILTTNPLPTGIARQAIDLLVAARLQPIIYENNVLLQHLYTGPARYDSAGARKYFAGNPELVRRLPYHRLIPPDNALQLAVIDDLPVLERIVPDLTLAGCRILLSYSGNLDSYFMEIFHASCSKGAALRDVADRYGLEMGQVVAVGDNLNDLEMLEMAGLGVAMGNADPAAQYVADRMTLSNDQDGVAALIDELLDRRWSTSVLAPRLPAPTDRADTTTPTSLDVAAS